MWKIWTDFIDSGWSSCGYAVNTLIIFVMWDSVVMNIIKNGAFGFEGFDSRISPETLSWSQSVIHQHLLSSTVVLRKWVSDSFISDVSSVSAHWSLNVCGELASLLCQKPISLSFIHCSHILGGGTHLTLIYDGKPERSPGFSSLTSDKAPFFSSY